MFPLSEAFNAFLNSRAAAVAPILLVNDVCVPPVNITSLNNGNPSTVLVYKSGTVILYVDPNAPNIVIVDVPKIIFPSLVPVTLLLFTAAVHNSLAFESNVFTDVKVIFLVAVSYAAV